MLPRPQIPQSPLRATSRERPPTPSPQSIPNSTTSRQPEYPPRPAVASTYQEPLPPLGTSSDGLSRHASRKIRKAPIIMACLLGLLVLTGLAAYIWYSQSLHPASTDEAQTVSIEVKQGWSWPTVAKELAAKGAIRSELAFTIYARMHGSALQQATCLIHPAKTSQEIVGVLASGCKGDTYKAVMFYPGATIEKPLYKHGDAQLDQTMYVKNVLSKAGYSSSEIQTALNKTYESPLFAGKPADATLEGYIFGDTYHVDADAKAEDVLQTAFAHMNAVIKQYDIEAKYAAQDLNLFQGITLASIVQRELNCEDKPTKERKDRCYEYQRMIAQVFLKRLDEGIMLGSDVTFIYAADMMGVPPAVDLDSPYNTRKYVGLPPGPVSTPGLLALRAVADPTDTEYLYFVAGDDGLIYFAKTLAEHEDNIRQHCHSLCQL